MIQQSKRNSASTMLSKESQTVVLLINVDWGNIFDILPDAYELLITVAKTAQIFMFYYNTFYRKIFYKGTIVLDLR